MDDYYVLVSYGRRPSTKQLPSKYKPRRLSTLLADPLLSLRSRHTFCFTAGCHRFLRCIVDCRKLHLVFLPLVTCAVPLALLGPGVAELLGPETPFELAYVLAYFSFCTGSYNILLGQSMVFIHRR